MKTKLLALGALFASLCASVQGQTPVLHLSFDNVSGSTVINDGSGSSAMDGTLNGTATIVGGGKFGNCLQVLGSASSDASCRIASAVVPLNVADGNAWTVAMWIKTTTRGGTWAYQGDGGWAANNTTFFMAKADTGTTGVNTHAPGGVRYGQGWQQGTTTVDNGQWHHIVFTFNGTNKVQYVDAVLDTWVANGWAVGSGDSGAGSQFWIGGGGTGQGDGQVCLNGLIDEAYVFDVALSASDVQKLYDNNSLSIVPVPVVVTVNPDRGLRGTVVTVTATATPAAGTVTNATADLSALGLSNAVQLVQSSPNLFTNSFTVPTNAPIGAASVKVRVIDTEPLVGSGATNFMVLARPPTNAIIVTQLTNVSAYEYTEVSFHFAATNDAPGDTSFPMTYAWYTNSVLVSTNPMGPYYTFLTTPGDNHLPIQCIARVVADTNYYSSLSVTSALVTLTVNSGTPVFTNGLKQEVFAGATRANVEIGNVGPGIVSLVTNADSTGGFGDNHARRYSGYFIPPANDAYVFFVASDDDCDVFLSTDISPVNKRLIAQEAGWSGTRNWQTAGGGGSTAAQKRSDQWSPDGGTTIPYAAGIPLLAGQKYYFEAVMHNGNGGDNWGVTYETKTELTADGTQPVDTSASRMTAASNNIAVVTWPGIGINWSLQPKTSVTVFEGQATNFTAIAVSDAEMTPNYRWYIVTNGGSLPGTPLTGKVVNGTNFTMSLIPANYNNAQVYCVASTEFGGLSTTSSVANLHVIQSVFEPGWVSEKRWMGPFNIAGAEAGTLGNPTFSAVRAGFFAGLDNPGSGAGDSTSQQIGYFVAPTNGNYVFFITSHDGGDLFLSTDNTAAHKQLVAQELGWSGNFAWNQAGGGGTVVSQKRSDQYSPDSGVTTPYATGVPLTAGTRYYMEVDHTTSRWGNEQFGVTYRVMDGSSSVTPPDDGSLPNCDGTNVGMSAIRCTYVTVTKQPSTASISCAEGSSATFSVAGTSDSLYPICSSYGYTITAPTNTLLCQWYKILNNVTNVIPGATETILTTGPLTTADNGARFYCTVRALGYADNSLNRIWTNSQTSGAITVTARSPSLLGHWVSGAASLADSANYVAPGVYDGGVVAGGQYYFTNDVPPGAPSGAQALYLQGTGIVISNTASSDAGYTVGTFDANIQSQCTVAFWAKGIPGGWNPWVSKYGESGQGWQLRVNNGGNSCWTIRGTGGNDDMSSPNTVDGNWHYYAGTFDAVTGTRNLYVDGVLDVAQTGEHAYTVAGPSHLMLGGRDNGGNNFGNFFTGSLYDVRIYNYPLTEQEVISVGHVALTFTSEIVPGGAGSQLVITWSLGTLLQATNVLGPWTTNSTVSPATIDMTAPQMFFRTQYP
jgi:Concanavalin A-like lectin/glucanases superfamily